jgi:hypothetical protein
VAGEALEKAEAPILPQTFPASQDANGRFDPSGVTKPIVNTIADKAFVLRDGVWTDTTFDPTRMTTTPFSFASREFLTFLEAHPEAARFFAQGERVIVVLDGVAYETTPADPEAMAAEPAAATSEPTGPKVVQTSVAPATQGRQEVQVTLETDMVQGPAPLKVTFTGTLVGGADNNPDFYCAEQTFNFGDGASQRISTTCLPWTETVAIQRNFTANHTYNRPGTYYAQFSLSNDRRLRSDLIKIVVENPAKKSGSIFPTEGPLSGMASSISSVSGSVFLMGGIMLAGVLLVGVVFWRRLIRA